MLKMLLTGLIVFVSGCAKKESKQPWGLKAPIVYSSKSDLKISFDRLDKQSIGKLGADDFIVFEDAQSGITLESKSECLFDDLRVTETYRGPLPQRLALLQLIHARAWLNSDKTSVCSIEFIATNAEGSQHYFNLQNFSVEGGAPTPTLDVRTTRVFRDSLDEVNFKSIIGRSYDFSCERTMAKAEAHGNILRLDEFALPDVANGDLCRIIERENGNIVGFSSSFRVFQNTPRIGLDLRINERVGTDNYRQRVPLQSWRIFNGGSSTVYLVLPETLPFTYRLDAAIPTLRSVLVPLNIVPQWEIPKNKFGLRLVSLRPNSDVIVELVARNLERCLTRTYPVGFWSRVESEGFISASMVNSPDQPLNDRNIVSFINLPLVNDRWISRPIMADDPSSYGEYFKDGWSYPRSGQPVAGKTCR